MFNKLPVTSNMVLCFVYGRNHKSLLESCKFYRFRTRTVYTCTRPCTRRSNGRVHSCVHRPCPWPCTGRVHGRVHGRVQAPCTRSVRVVDTAVCKPCTRLLQGRARVVNTAMYCTRLHAMYTAVYVHGPCTRPCICTARVQGRYTTVQTVVSRALGS